MIKIENNKYINQVILGDCLKVMKEVPDKSINLIVTDPPYNIKKAEWDKWKKKEDYIEWCGQWLLECQRVLKDNGSFYFFHNDFLQIVELQNWINKNTNFVFKQFIVWNKRFEGAKNKGFLDGFVEVGGLRNYQQMTEYCLFYTFQDETGLTTIMLDTNNFPTMRNYFKDLQEYIGLKLGAINKTLRHRKAEHCFYWKSTQWDIPTKETYQELINVFKIDKWEGFKEYESLRQEYESLRYTFNNQKTHHSVWNYEITKKIGHATPKPVEVIESIIKHSSNEGDVILDLFLGSGTTVIACINTNRNYIGIEKDKNYYNIAKERIEKHKISIINT